MPKCVLPIIAQHHRMCWRKTICRKGHHSKQTSGSIDATFDHNRKTSHDLTTAIRTFAFR